MEKERGLKFIKWINIHTDKMAYVVPAIDFDEINQLYLAHMAARIDVTKSRTAPIEKDLQHVKFRGTTITHTIHAAEMLGELLQTVYFESDDHLEDIVQEIIFINIIDTCYGRLVSTPHGLHMDVLEGLAEV